MSSRIIEHLRARNGSTVAYFLCDSYTENDRCSVVLRSLALQLVRQHLDLASYVADSYVNKGTNASIAQLKKLLPELLAGIPSTFIILDGLDECDERDQKSVLTELVALTGPSCKLLVSSRDGIYISKILRKRPTLSLKDKRKDVDADIRLFVNHSLSELRERFGDTVIDNVEEQVVRKAEGECCTIDFGCILNKILGMFLWVKLVISTLEGRYSLSELQAAVKMLPEGLNAA